MIVHARTQTQLDNFADHPSHALLIIGSKGVGKDVIVNDLVEKILGRKILNNPNVMRLASKDDKPLGISDVRDAIKFLMLKVAGQTGETNRVVIIPDAQNLKDEAQNALLKTVEEPPRGSVVIITTDDVTSILPTIRSRTQEITILTPSTEDSIKYFEEQGFATEDIKRAIAMSGGLPGLTHALLDDQSHPLKQAAEQARAIIVGDAYDKLLLVESLSKDKQAAQDVLKVLAQMVQISLKSSDEKATGRWAKILKSTHEAQEALVHNANLKLVLDQLMLNL